MLILIFTLLITLFSTSLLIFSSSLPLQALCLFLIRLSVAGVVGSTISPLIGIYIVLIYSRGLLVLLAYFVALSPNQTLNIPSSPTLLVILFSIFILSALTFPSLSYLHIFNSNSQSFSLVTILTPSRIALLSIIGTILILTIVAVVKILRISSKPIRP